MLFSKRVCSKKAGTAIAVSPADKFSMRNSNRGRERPRLLQVSAEE
jgi:hypothetical protein